MNIRFSTFLAYPSFAPKHIYLVLPAPVKTHAFSLLSFVPFSCFFSSPSWLPLRMDHRRMATLPPTRCHSGASWPSRRSTRTPTAPLLRPGLQATVCRSLLSLIHPRSESNRRAKGNRAFGGHVYAQAAYAAGRTVPKGMMLHVCPSPDPDYIYPTPAMWSPFYSLPRAEVRPPTTNSNTSRT